MLLSAQVDDRPASVGVWRSSRGDRRCCDSRITEIERAPPLGERIWVFLLARSEFFESCAAAQCSGRLPVPLLAEAVVDLLVAFVTDWLCSREGEADMVHLG